MENSAVEPTDHFRPAHGPSPGRVAGADDGKIQMDLSSVIAPAVAILPFAAVLALCIFLLSLPSGEGTRIVDPPVVRFPEPIEAPASSPASGDDLFKGNIPQATLVEVNASFPDIAAPVVDTKPDAVSAMAAWWAQRARHDHAAPRKVGLFTRQYRRHREVVQSEMGCPPSVCLGSTEKSAAPPLLPN
jgi:hypothetical protein